MKPCRKPVAMVLLLLVHLLTLQIGDAGRNHAHISNAKGGPKIILEEVIIAGSGNNTRVIANAVAEDASRLDNGILSLLPERETRRSRRISDQDDQDAAQSGVIAIGDANEEDDLEVMSRVIAKYEPQRLTMRKAKRKIVDGLNGTHDVRGEIAGSVTELERAYAETLRDVSRKTAELSPNGTDVTLNPYLSQAARQLKQVHVPEAAIRPATNDGAERSHSDVDSSLASPNLSKKPRKLPKNYLNLNRTAATPRFSSGEESDERSAGAGGDPGAPDAFRTFNGRAKPRNGSLYVVPTSNVHPGPTEKLKSRREWNVQDSPIQNVPQFTTRLNNGDDVINVNDLNLTTNAPNNAVQPQPRHNVVPRPFSVLQSPNAPVTANVHHIDNASHRKANPSPTGFGHQKQTARSSANVLPFVLPTDLSNPSPARHYIPIKRPNHLNLKGNSATISTEASLPPSAVGERSTLANYALYTVIATTKSPSVPPVNGQQSSLDYYAVTTASPVTKTNFAATYVPGQTSAVQWQDSQAVRKNDFLPGIPSYGSPAGEKSSSNEGTPGVALSNKFAGLYSTSVPGAFNVSKAITPDFKQPQPSQQQVSALPHATLRPLTPVLLKALQPIASSKSTPTYYDSGFFSQDKKYDKGVSSDNDETNVRPRVEDEKEDNEDVGNYKIQVSQEVPSKQREKKARDEVEEEKDRYPQQSRNYRYQDKDEHRKYDENDGSNKNDDSREKYENVRRGSNDDGEEVEETEGEEYASIEKSKDNDAPRYQYTNYEYDKDSDKDSDEEQSRKKSDRYVRKKYKRPKDRDDHESDTGLRFESNDKYFESLHNDDDDKTRERGKKFRSDKKRLVDDDRYKKERQGRKYEGPEDESVAEDKPFAQRFKDQRAYYRPDESYEEERGGKDGKRDKHHSPRKNSRRDEHTGEEYGETNPARAREKYRRQRVKNVRPVYESQDDDHVHGETQEHAHKHEGHHGKKDGGDREFEEGGAAEHKEEHHGHEGEKGEKGYKVWHEDEKAKKGHIDKEDASKHYDEKDGKKKEHEEEGGYHEEHHHGEGGEKKAEFGEKGEHKKGHSTHGEHSVHKKDEFEKKTEFFDEFHEHDGTEKHGEHHHGHESEKGGHVKKGHHDSADHEEKHGKAGKHEKGEHHHEHKGHKDEEGHDRHYDHDEKHGEKKGHEHAKKWNFKKGDDGGGDHKHKR